MQIASVSYFLVSKYKYSTIMLLKYRLLHLLLGSVFLSSASQANELPIEISGFGKVVGGYLDDPDLAYQGYEDELSFDSQINIKLKETSIVVIGAGGLGSPALLYLAAAGIGKITIVDGDVVDASNLHRQILYNESDIGAKKAEIAVKKLADTLLDIGV